MDVDNHSEALAANPGLETLLQQFSCMGTTDRDELIQQLQKLLGSHINYNTAAFYLDMNNWNLQAAICSYLDIDSSNQLPSMTLISDPVANECENMEPNTQFVKIWHIRNSGTDTWPAGCFAQCSDGSKLSASRLIVPCVGPGESTTLFVNMTAPSELGMYQSKWRLCTSRGTYFGDPMWVIVAVVEEGPTKLAERLSHFNELGASPPMTDVITNPFVSHRSYQQGTSPPDGSDPPNMC